LGEEIGFRGYLLPRLMPLGTPRALLVSGLLHGIWHFPLILLTSALPINGTWLIAGPLFLLVLTAAGTFYGFLYLDSGSVWAPTLAHGTINALINLFKAITVTASPVALQYLVGETGVFTLVMTALFAGWVFYRLRQPHRPVAAHMPGGL
jgi:membrane protease YdiL (CAAX protease family)